MKKRTSFSLLDDGTVYCSCGTVRDFAKDLNEFIVPLLEFKIQAEFNRKTITVYAYDDEQRILKRLMEALNE